MNLIVFVKSIICPSKHTDIVCTSSTQVLLFLKFCTGGIVVWIWNWEKNTCQINSKHAVTWTVIQQIYNEIVLHDSKINSVTYLVDKISYKILDDYYFLTFTLILVGPSFIFIFFSSSFSLYFFLLFSILFQIFLSMATILQRLFPHCRLLLRSTDVFFSYWEDQKL